MGNATIKFAKNFGKLTLKYILINYNLWIKKMKKICLALVGIGLLVTACNSGGSSSNSSEYLACAVNMTGGTGDNLSLQSYINNSSLTVNPDVLATSFGVPTSNLYNGLFFMNSTANGGLGSTFVYLVSTQSMLSTNIASFVFDEQNVPSGACYNGTYSTQTESSAVTLTSCQSSAQQANQVYTFSATYNIAGNGSGISASTGSLAFSCTLINPAN